MVPGCPGGSEEAEGLALLLGRVPPGGTRLPAGTLAFMLIMWSTIWSIAEGQIWNPEKTPPPKFGPP